MARLSFATLVALSACKKDDELVLTQFNGDDDILLVCVGEGDCVPEGEIDLHSTNGSTLVGTASVDPASGPVGTVHTVTVNVDDEWEDQVLSVSAEFIGARGQQTWELRQDSADHGNWEIDVESLGEVDESRDDEIRLLLFEDVGSATVITTTETSETSS